MVPGDLAVVRAVEVPDAGLVGVRVLKEPGGELADQHIVCRAVKVLSAVRVAVGFGVGVGKSGECGHKDIISVKCSIRTSL